MTWGLRVMPLVALVALVAASANAYGDDEVALSDLIEIAVRRSPQLAMARADHDEARYRHTSAGAVDAWRVLGRATARDSVIDRALAGPGDKLGSRSIHGELGVQRSLSTGASVEAAVELGTARYLYRSFSALSMSGGGAEDQAISGTVAAAKLTASQPLARGRGADVARADQKLARLDARAQSANSSDAAAAAIRDLVIAYWELAYAAEQLAVDLEGEALAVRQAEITREVVRNGLQPPSAMKIAELRLALRRDAILRDRAALVDQSLVVRRLAGLELEATPLAPTDAPEIPPTQWSEDDAVAAALAHGPGVAAHVAARRSADVRVDVASNATLPRIDASITAELSGVGASAGEAFGHVGEAQMYTVIGGVSMQWELGSSARAGEAAARVHRRRLVAERKDLDARVTAAAMSAVRRLELARKRASVSEIAVAVAAEALRAEVVAFQAGRTTNVAVFQREDDVAEAKLRLARARIDAIEASIQLDYLTGALLQRFGIHLTRDA